MTSMFELLAQNGNDFTDHDLAHLAEWANNAKEDTPNPSWKRAYALIREGADLLLRRRAMAKMEATKTPQPLPTTPTCLQDGQAVRPRDAHGDAIYTIKGHEEINGQVFYTLYGLNGLFLQGSLQLP